MEEQRDRQQAEAGAGGAETGEAPAVVTGGEDESSEEAMLQRALAMSMDTGEAGGAGGGSTGGQAQPAMRDLSSMTEEEQIAYAMQMSMADAEKPDSGAKTESMDVDDKDEDYSEVMNDPAFLQSVLQNLPGVDPQSEAVRNAVGAAKDEKEKKEKEEKK